MTPAAEIGLGLGLGRFDYVFLLLLALYSPFLVLDVIGLVLAARPLGLFFLIHLFKLWRDNAKPPHRPQKTHFT
jgi:hypothetical protein